MDDLASIIEQAAGPAQAQNKPSDNGFDASVIADAINTHAQENQTTNQPAQPVQEDTSSLHKWYERMKTGANVLAKVGSEATPISPFVNSDKTSHNIMSNSPLVESGVQAITGTGAMLAGGLSFWGKLITSGDAEAAAKFANDVQSGLTYQPSSKIVQGINNATGTLLEKAAEGGGHIAGPLGAAIGKTAAVAAPLMGGVRAHFDGSNPVMNQTGESSQAGSLGAAAAKQSEIAASAGASPEIQAAIKSAESKGSINPQAAQAHIEASSLPVPIKLTAGQALQDVNQLSIEKNARSAMPELAERFNEQGAQLKQNIEAIRDQAAPDVFHANHVEAGQALIDSYKEKDSVINSVIADKYNALKKAASEQGINAPIDAPVLANNIKSALQPELLDTESLTPEVRKLVTRMENNDFGDNSHPMNFQDFINARKLISQQQIENKGTTAGVALGIVRDQLESLPLTGAAEQLKPLLTDASNAARARFKLIDSDPAYKAAITDATPADSFIQKYVVKAPVQDVAAMKHNLSGDSIANQTIAHGAINYLKSRAGENFSQAGYNKAMQDISPKLNLLVEGNTANQLEALGNTARRVQAQPAGSYVNNSSTFVAEAGKAASNAAESMIPGVGMAKNIVQQFKNRAMVKDMLKPGAGIEK